MNRDLGRGTDTLQQASSSNYLIYLFIVSASFVVLLPYLLPFGGSLLRSSKKGSVVKEDTVKIGPPYTYPSLSTDVVVPRSYMYDRKQDDLEVLLMDLRRTIQIERERTFQLENEIRILHLSERFLKERIQKLEDRSLEQRRGIATGSVPIELFLQKTENAQNKQDNLDASVQELLRMLQAEKQRTNELAMEIKILRMSESILVDRIKNLEDRFNAFLSIEGRSKHFDSKYEQRDLEQN